MSSLLKRVALALFILSVSIESFRPPSRLQHRSDRLCTRLFAGEADNLDKMTVAEIKSVLRTKSLPVSGLKAELIDRLRASMVEPSVPWDKNSDFKIKSESITAKQNTNAVSPATTTPSAIPSFLDFDDTVFDEAIENSRGAEKREMREKKSWNDNQVSEAAMIEIGKKFQRSQAVQVKILRYGPLGASVLVDSIGQGLVLQQDIVYWQATNGKEPRPGDELPAFVESVRSDGKINVSLRPVGYEKINSARNMLLEALEALPGDVKVLPLGDKSTPDEIWRVFPGMSKGYFKHAVGYLLRLGAVEISTDKMTYIPEGKRVPIAAQPYSGKSPRGWKFPEGATLFVANLAFSTDSMTLAEAVERKIGYGKVAAVQISKDGDTGKARGFAYISFFTPELARESLALLGNGLKVDGREVRFETQQPAASRPPPTTVDGKPAAARDWGSSSMYGIKGVGKPQDGDSDKTQGDSGSPKLSSTKREESSWVTVFAGDLPYKLEPEVFQFLIEDALGEDGKGTVAAVRLTKDFATGKSRGFGFVDFYDMETAQRVVKELSGMTVMGRPIRLDIEGPKKPLGTDGREGNAAPRFGEGGRKRFDGPRGGEGRRGERRGGAKR